MSGHSIVFCSAKRSSPVKVVLSCRLWRELRARFILPNDSNQFDGAFNLALGSCLRIQLVVWHPAAIHQNRVTKHEKQTFFIFICRKPITYSRFSSLNGVMIQYPIKLFFDITPPPLCAASALINDLGPKLSSLSCKKRPRTLTGRYSKRSMSCKLWSASIRPSVLYATQQMLTHRECRLAASLSPIAIGRSSLLSTASARTARVRGQM